MTLTLPKAHLSPSQVTMFRKCGEQYRLRYVEDLVLPPAAAMHSGSAVHEAAAARHLQRQEADTEMARSEVVDRAVAAFDHRVEEDGVELRGEDELRGKDVVLGEARDTTAGLAGGFADQVAPRVLHPLAVEERLTVMVPALGVELLGIIDLAYQDDELGLVIEDLKTGKKAKSQADADGSDQLSWYALSWLATHGELPGAVALRSLSLLKRGPSSAHLVSRRTQTDVQQCLSAITETARAISAGAFPPSPEGAWWCGPQWCGYWGRGCRFHG